MISVSYGAL